MSSEFTARIRPHVERELAAAARAEGGGDSTAAFRALERAHVLAQRSTGEHVRVHARMLAFYRRRGGAGVFGQLVRIVGAATKSRIGWVPEGNTGGSDVPALRTMPVPADLAAVLADARRPGADDDRWG